MSNQIITDVLIPAINEEKSIAKVINDIPKSWVRHIIVCDNGSLDNTRKIALSAGAIVVHEPERGYGNTCLNGMAYISELDMQPDVIVFLDGDYSDYPEQIPELLKPIMDQSADLVIGSRVRGHLQKGAMMPQQIFGNWLATTLIKLFYNYNYTDLGPFRSVRYDRLMEMKMADKTYGWTVEMQVKAAKAGMICYEVPVDYRPRIGTSKVSGTVKGTLLAGHKILWTIFKLL